MSYRTSIERKPTEKHKEALPAKDLLEMAECEMVPIFELISQLRHEIVPICEKLLDLFDVDFKSNSKYESYRMQRLVGMVFDRYYQKAKNLNFLNSLEDAEYDDFPYKAKNKDGYVEIYSSNLKFWKLEHRYVVEKTKNIKLKRSEVVHHINGNKSDNRLENLEIMTASDHSRMHGFKRGKLNKLTSKQNK